MLRKFEVIITNYNNNLSTTIHFVNTYTNNELTEQDKYILFNELYNTITTMETLINELENLNLEIHKVNIGIKIFFMIFIILMVLLYLLLREGYLNCI